MTQLIPLRSGRNLEIAEYGDPAGHPALFFHGLIGSHFQASYIDEEAQRSGLRIIAPNRPGVGRSDFVRRKTVLDAVPDVEDLADALGLAEFSVIGISGGAPYALATLFRLGQRLRTVTLLSGMGPLRLKGGLRGMERKRRLFLELASRSPRWARKVFEIEAEQFAADSVRFLQRLVRTWSKPDQVIFKRSQVFDLFLKDIHEVFTHGIGAEGLAQELALYRNFGFSLRDLPGDKPVIVWQGLDDTIVPPAMGWALVQALPNRQAHFVPGGHFVAVDIARQIIDWMKKHVDRV